MLLRSRGGSLFPLLELRVPKQPELLWDEPHKGSVAVTTSTWLKKISLGSVLDRMEVFWVKILLNVQFEHLVSVVVYLLM